jgi:hypothetical protein
MTAMGADQNDIIFASLNSSEQFLFGIFLFRATITSHVNALKPRGTYKAIAFVHKDMR